MLLITDKDLDAALKAEALTEDCGPNASAADVWFAMRLALDAVVERLARRADQVLILTVADVDAALKAEAAFASTDPRGVGREHMAAAVAEAVRRMEARATPPLIDRSYVIPRTNFGDLDWIELERVFAGTWVAELIQASYDAGCDAAERWTARYMGDA